MPSEADAPLLIPAYETINAAYLRRLSAKQLKEFFDRLCKFYRNSATKDNTLLYCYRKSAPDLLHFAVVADHVNAVDMLFEMLGGGEYMYCLKDPTYEAVLAGHAKLALHLMTEYGIALPDNMKTLVQQSPQIFIKQN